MFKALRKQLTLIAASTLLSAFSLASIVVFTDPNSGNILTLLFFYLSLFLVAVGILTTVGLAGRTMLRSGLYMTQLVGSFRQAALISLLLVISLLLQAQGLLYWWVELSLILFFASIEIFFNLKI